MTDEHMKQVSENFQGTIVSACDRYNPDKVFDGLKVVEFPISFVGLSSSLYLNVDIDLNTSAYLKTMYKGNLMKFNKARDISASHRAFHVTSVNERTLLITYKPLIECISRAKLTQQFNNRFVCDLRLIQVDGLRCCNNELHSEIGRYYICGEFEYCNITHSPKTVNFDNVKMNSKLIKYVTITNESKLISANMQYIRTTGFEVTPPKFTILPNFSKVLSIQLNPKSLKILNTLKFKVRNPHNLSDDIEDDDENFLIYNIKCNFNIMYDKRTKNITIESMHKLNEPDARYTYLNEELKKNTNRKTMFYKYLEMYKKSYIKKLVTKKRCTEQKISYLNTSFNVKKTPMDLCKEIREKITPYSLFDISLLPFLVDFGRVGLFTYGEKDLIVKNNSKYDITINLSNDEYVLYTEEKLKVITFKLKPSSIAIIKLFCLGFVEGSYRGTFEYTIDNRYIRKHPYILQVANPTLMIAQKCIKFGMVTTESFITSVPIRIYNFFNVTVDFKWDKLHSDMPFEIIPSSGSITKNSCKICDILYICKESKSDIYEVNLLSESTTNKVIPIELKIITRKLSIKFLQPTLIFRDIALNVETIKTIKLENSSREFGYFHVVEPLMPGFSIQPMSGKIRPKMIITFDIIVKICCILEFAFNIYIKINNKENVILPVSGNVIEPKLVVHPKHIYMSNIPCNLITYVPITFQNNSALKTIVEVLDTGDENIFNVYLDQGNDKQKVFGFNIEGGQSKTILIKVYDIFSREYEMYIPFKINGLLGPPDQNSSSTKIEHYIKEYEQLYKNNTKVKLKTVNQDISFCKITGIITLPWITFSKDTFEIDYLQNSNNSIEFSMTNISNHYLHITIITSKLSPNFTLDLLTEETEFNVISQTNIKFELDRKDNANFRLHFHPNSDGKFISTALLYLDKDMTTPYYNLTFIGKKETPLMKPSTYYILFPPCYVGTKCSRIITLKLESESNLDSFSFECRDEPNLNIKFIDSAVIFCQEKCHTEVTVEITVICEVDYARNILLIFGHDSGSNCKVEVSFCFTYCPLTLHTTSLVEPIENPYPYYPQSTQKKLYEYLEICSIFLEKWMFQQGFRKDLYPIIPDTFHAISSNIISSQTSDTKSKELNISYLNFMRRISGPVMKHIHKISGHGVDDSFKIVKEIHDTYKEIINLLQSRGSNLWILQARFLLSFEHFNIYSENVKLKSNADIILTTELLENAELYNRLNKQTWIDFILQSYKVFVIDSCFLGFRTNTNISSQPRDIIKVLVDWYNEQIASQHEKLRSVEKPCKIIENITSDLSDGIALISAIMNYCPFMKEHFTIFCEIEDENKISGIINNACLVIEALNLLRLYFPLTSKDLLKPNFLQMLFLSIHLYVTLPMFKPRDSINFNPPLLRSSTREVIISSASKESLIFNYVILNNSQNNFRVEKATTGDISKKTIFKVKYIANFVDEKTGILLVHGYNKTRIFDTYVVFLLNGSISALTTVRKCKVTGPLYRPVKVDILISSPFTEPATYQIYLTDKEPVLPVIYETLENPKFYVRRLNLIDNVITLSGFPKENEQGVQEHKLYLKMTCFSMQISNSWIWLKSEVGQFFIKVTSQPRCDLAIDTLQAKVNSWPMDPCSCEESCECYRTTVIMVPHRNDNMVKSLRYALLEHASDVMIQVFDKLIVTTTGKIILGILLSEGGTNMCEIQHILNDDIGYRINSRTLLPQLDYARLKQHTSAILPIPVTVPPSSSQNKSEKYSVTFTSDCGMDIRVYRIIFVKSSQDKFNC